MSARLQLLSSAAVATVLWGLTCASAGAQTAGSQSTAPIATAADTGSTPQAAAGAAPEAGSTPGSGNTVNEVVVTGLRASLQGAQSIRRNSTDIVDSIVAQDIGKFPDNTVGDALQRITGVQITRAAGEASSVLVRGLPNVTTEINGRDIFTTTGRSVSLSDLPAELVSGLDVYKTVSADQLEGGIAGLINIRLRRPLDFDGLEVAGTVRGIYGDQRDALDPNGSLLVSDRWHTGIGDVGALLSLSYQKRRYLDETAFNFVSIAGPTNPATGQPLQIPQTTGDIAALGDRTRYGANFSAQWRPSNNLEFYFDSIYTGYRNNTSNDYFIGIPGAGNLQSFTTEPGSNEVASLSSLNNFTLTSNQAFEARTDTFQNAFGGKWSHDRLTVTSDASYTYSIFQQRDVILDTRFNAPTYAVNFLQNGTPNSVLGGVDVTSANNFDLNQLFDDHERQVGDELALRIDATYDLDLPFIKSVTVGFRYAYRTANSEASNGNGIPAPAGSAISAASLPGLGTLSPANFLGGDRSLAVTQWFNADPQYTLSHTDQLRALFGQAPGEQPYDPALTFHATQHSYAGYIKANFDFSVADHPVTGDFGVRVVDTDESLLGFQVLPFTTNVSAVDSTPSYQNVLPSFNGKVGLIRNVYFRVSAGKTVTFPDFSALNPALSLNSPGPTLIGTGTAGNPNLKPTTSTNVDAALEWYFAKTGSVTGTYFHRDINGYIENFGVPTVVNNISYLVTEPESTGAGELQGLELAYQQFYDFLPPLFKGFGTQANFTYIDSYTMSPASPGAPSVKQALANVSRYSYNLVGIYERGPFSARLAYNWRSKYVVAFNAGGDQPQTIISQPYGDLDMSMSYALTPKLVLTADLANLTRTVSQDYFGNPTLFPRDTARSDRTFELGLRFRL
ncbi:TonB-dependent receptor [Caulobacter sp. S45]|uniref:TonB-dependent receptor n=1 Tax=Caulobacter sp. S45 TaxID=1641861 RepID=UPI00131AB118|nr:TonB-dependent receptor [Caulobacter sp. S45]